MAVQTGRTPSKFVRVIIGDSSNTLREVPVNKIGSVGLTYPEVDLTAIQDALRGFLQGIPNFSMTLGGPLDTTAAVAIAASGAAPALSGAHVVLRPLSGLMVPRSFGVLIGIRHYWETGEPAFTISQTSTSGMLVSEYVAIQNGEAMEYSCKLFMYPASAAPTWSDALPT